jgi:hypothetical protein
VADNNVLEIARRRPSGARFFRCALQVNPFHYAGIHGKPSSFENEDDYNEAVVKECFKLGIEVIAVTDHYRVKSSAGLIDLAREAGIHVFPGFEAVTKDGVHLLCLFDPGTSLDTLERILGDCGIHKDHRGSPTGEV